MVSTFRKKINELGEEYGKLGLDNIVKEVVNGAFKNAGKSKDEIIQLLGREIGLAWAAVLKEPMEKLIENKSLSITIELVSKDKNSKSEKNSKNPPDPNEENPSSSKDIEKTNLSNHSKKTAKNQKKKGKRKA